MSVQTPKDSLQTSGLPSYTTHIISDGSAIHLSHRPHSSAISRNTKWNRNPWSAPRQTWRSCGGRARESTPPSTSSERPRWDAGANATNFPVKKKRYPRWFYWKNGSVLLMKAVSEPPLNLQVFFLLPDAVFCSAEGRGTLWWRSAHLEYCHMHDCLKVCRHIRQICSDRM